MCFYFFTLFFKELYWLTRVSKSHGHTVVQPRKKRLTLCKILRFACASWKFMHFNLICIFSSSCFTHNKWFLVIFLHFFLRKIWKLKFWPRKKTTFRMSGTSIVILPQIWFLLKKKNLFLFKAQNCLETCETPLFTHVEVQFSFFFFNILPCHL